MPVTSNKNFLSSIGFKLVIDGYPNTSFFCQRVSLPGLTIGDTTVNLPQSNWQFVGDKYVFNPLEVTLIVDEDMENYLEIYNWMNDIIMADDVYSQIKRASVVILSSHNNPIKTFSFNNVFPISMSNLDLELTQTDIQYSTTSITFAYSTFEVE